MKYRLFALIAIVIMLALPAAACKSYVDMSGYVYIWVNAPPGAVSQVSYSKTPPVGQEVVPLKGAKVVLEDDDKSHRFELATNAEGYFHIGTTVELDEDMNIDVEAQGYLEAHGKFDVIADESFYYFVILLVPES